MNTDEALEAAGDPYECERADIYDHVLPALADELERLRPYAVEGAIVAEEFAYVDRAEFHERYPRLGRALAELRRVHERRSTS